MAAVWVVVVVLAIGAAGVAYASRRHGDDVEPSVREFTEFRDAISRQVAGVHTDTRATRRHLDRQTSSADLRGDEHPSQS
jgi:hypothetical protein